MAVLKKIRSRWWSQADEAAREAAEPESAAASLLAEIRYDVRPLTVAQLDECWRLDQRCFVDGEAYSRDTFEYLLTAPESVSYRAVTQGGAMVGFIVGLVEPDHTGHITTVGVAQAARNRTADAAKSRRRLSTPPGPRHSSRSPLGQRWRAAALPQSRLRRHAAPPALLLKRRRRLPDD
jgi:hypothetical protein